MNPLWIADQVRQDPLIGGLIDAVGSMPDSDPARLVAVTDLAARHLLARPVALSGLTAGPDNLAKTLASRWKRATGAPLPEHLRQWLTELSDARYEQDPAKISLLGQRARCATHLAELREVVLETLGGSAVQ